MTQMRIIASPIERGPQNGASTHHHDQVITLHSFSVMKISPRMAINGKLDVVVF